MLKNSTTESNWDPKYVQVTHWKTKKKKKSDTES